MVRLYENNISEDIVYADDNISSSSEKISNKLDKAFPFFLVVLDKNEKILGVIKIKELKNMLNEMGERKTTKVPFGANISKHTIIKEDEIPTKAEAELEKTENGGFILIKNNSGNYLGKIFKE